jgi:hypothetical protein
MITNSQCTIVVKFFQDFVVSIHSDFFQGPTDRGLIYGLNHSIENLLSKQEREEENNSADVYSGLKVIKLFTSVIYGYS